jgi:hypothetical protein
MSNIKDKYKPGMAAITNKDLPTTLNSYMIDDKEITK